ncbi:glycosyltransferase family 25 protein [Polycladidibacter stylochi]|uniref:glycosyltransferase family 25 protein n=1 Tax=Polycladidibacter stylochi TaxID=1807766 RepID=UPI000832AE25|nr:glycosyltransferase family 25 protein [Pseudovibrio stylochi]
MHIKYFAINLEKAVERRQHMQLQAAKWGLDIHFFCAVTPDTMVGVQHKYYAKKAQQHFGRELAPTELACGLSHLELWRQLEQDDTADAFVIFEDDVIIETDLPRLLAGVRFADIKLLKLANLWQSKGYVIEKLTEGYELVQVLKTSEGAGAYLIAKDAVSSLIDYCQDFRKPIDTLVDDYTLFKTAAHSIFPHPVLQVHEAAGDTPLASSLDSDRASFVNYRMGKKNWLRYKINKRKWKTHKKVLELIFRVKCVLGRNKLQKYPGVLS